MANVWNQRGGMRVEMLPLWVLWKKKEGEWVRVSVFGFLGIDENKGAMFWSDFFSNIRDRKHNFKLFFHFSLSLFSELWFLLLLKIFCYDIFRVGRNFYYFVKHEKIVLKKTTFGSVVGCCCCCRCRRNLCCWCCCWCCCRYHNRSNSLVQTEVVLRFVEYNPASKRARSSSPPSLLMKSSQKNLARPRKKINVKRGSAIWESVRLRKEDEEEEENVEERERGGGW